MDDLGKKAQVVLFVFYSEIKNEKKTSVHICAHENSSEVLNLLKPLL